VVVELVQCFTSDLVSYKSLILEQKLAVIGSDMSLGTAAELAEAEDGKHTDHGMVFGS
jgi:hypothetical protein